MTAGATVEGWAALVLRTRNKQIGQNGYQKGQKEYKNDVNEYKYRFFFLLPREGQKVSKTNSDQKHVALVAYSLSVLQSNIISLLEESIVMIPHLFNAKSCFYIYIKYMISKHILLIHIVKCKNNSISDNSI